MRSIKEAVINSGSKVFVRCDLDVPIKDGQILEKYRLDSALETLFYIKEKGGIPVIAGHIGKPEGIFTEELSTKPLIPYFEEKLGKNCFELLENLRFDPGEESNNHEFAITLSHKIDLYVNESFATCHREHASIVTLPKIIPAFAGFNLQSEVQTITSLASSAQKPFVAVVGGAKLESKMPVISKLLTIADKVLLGGKLALAWKDPIPQNLILAEDFVDGKDIGEKSVQNFINLLSQARTILWVGPLGAYEEDAYFNGTKKIAQEIARLTKIGGVTSVVGGGDTIASVEKAGVLSDFSFVSTGGSAMLELIVKGTLPGIEILN